VKSKAKGKTGVAERNYESFYRDGGWNLGIARAVTVMQRLADACGWSYGTRLLDLGCGEGDYTEAARRVGCCALGVDISKEGLKLARRNYPEAMLLRVDLAEWEPVDLWDVLFARGMSWFHYELGGVNRYGIDVPYELRRFLTWLKPGGQFILQVSTDFSGENKETVLYNTLEAYLQLLVPLGKLVVLTDWQGAAIIPGRVPASGIIIGIKIPETTPTSSEKETSHAEP
jgi:cyclopropane fatty-acyl-phospholipid synthase-like methyltransferase